MTIRVRLAAATLLLAGLVTAGCLSHRDQPLFDPDLVPMELGGPFELASAEGPIDLKTFRGQAVWLFFGYGSCPDACPTALARVARARKILEKKGWDSLTETLFVSFDGDRDTPAKLKEYMSFFGSTGVGATGTPEQIATMMKAYGASYERVSGSTPDTYQFNHSTYIYLLDCAGRVRHMFRHEDTPERIADVTGKLILEGLCRPGAAAQ